MEREGRGASSSNPCLRRSPAHKKFLSLKVGLFDIVMVKFDFSNLPCKGAGGREYI